METVCLILSLCLKATTLYFGVVALFALKRRKEYPRAAPATRFAVVIAARNEEAVIANPVRSVLCQNYPPYLRDVYVVPNSCTDCTARAAEEAGAEIIRCPRTVRSKGAALHTAFAQLLEMDYDAFLVLDADNTLSPDYLARVNDAVAAGARVFKTRTRAANAFASPVAGCYGLYNVAFDLLWNRPRAACGLSAKVIGTGFGFTREYLEELGGWNTRTIAEDAEFAAGCARRRERVWWVPEAVNYDEEPTSFRVSLRQRRRWCSGVMQVGRQELPRLLRGGGGVLGFDMTMFLLAPFAQALSFLALLAGLLCSGEGLLAGMALYWLAGTALAGVLSALGGFGLRDMVGAILLFPAFMLSWLPLQVLSLFRDTREWKPIPHTGSLYTLEPRG